MRFNKRGDLGFPEAIMAAMAVTLSLTLYMGVVVLSAAEEEDSFATVDHRIFSDLSLSDGEVAGDIEMRLIAEMERHGYKGITFICEVPGELGFEGKRTTIGNMEGRISSERFVFLLNSSDGRQIPAMIEVAVCA
jgi:hypothetical protein